MQQFDVIILGNGILAMSSALELTKSAPNIRIAIVGPSSQKGSATLAAGAMLGCFSEVTEATLLSMYGRAVLDMSFKALKVWPDWLNELNQYLPEQLKISTRPGTFIISNTETAQYENDNFNAILTALNQYNAPFETVDPNNIPGLSPIETCRPFKSLFLPKEGAINPAELLNGLSAFLRQKNVVMIDEIAVDFSYSSEKVKHVITDSGTTLVGDKILLAAGAYSQALLDKIPDIAKRIPKVFAGLGCSAIFRNTRNKIPVQSVIRTPNRANACGVHILPTDKQADYLYMGASNTCILGPTVEPRIRDVYYLLKRAMEQINHTLHNKSMVKYQVGNRPVTMDTFPLIGRTSMKNLWVLTGTYRIGLQLAPILAKSIADSMLNSASSITDLNVDLFKPERRLIQAFTKKEAIDIFVKQHFGTGYEHEMLLPKMGWESMIIDAIHQKAADIYDKLETDIAIYPDILSMIDQNRELLPILKDYLKTQDYAYSLAAA